MSDLDFSSIAAKAVEYVKSLKSPDSFAFRHSNVPEASPIAISSSVAVLILNFLSCLNEEYSEAQREQWCEYLLSNLGDDGLCCDETDLQTPVQKQPFWALRLHRTRHIVWAIEALGGSIKTQPAIIESLLAKDGAAKWLDDLWRQDWPGGFWAAGNWIMDIGVALDITWRHFKNKDSYNAIFELMNALDEKQCPQTGFWFGPNDSNREAMAGAMHLYPMYWAYGREVKYFDKAVECTLELQQTDGLFGYEIDTGGNQCLDYDSILVLANGAVLCPQYESQIVAATEKVLPEIMKNQQSDGSFSDCRIPAQSCWATLAASYKSNGGSLWDTYARIMTIASCIEIATGKLPPKVKFEHHWFEVFHGLWEKIPDNNVIA